MLPATTVDGPVLLIERSADAAAVTVVVSEELLLAGFGSAVVADTVPVLVIVPVAVGAVTTIVAVELPPVARAPIVQVTVPALLAHPVEADWKPTPVGSVSETVTPVALLGPALLTDSV